LDYVLNRGGHVLATGDLGLNLPDDARRGLLAHPLVVRSPSARLARSECV
jgi:hypothetical protein